MDENHRVTPGPGNTGVTGDPEPTDLGGEAGRRLGEDGGPIGLRVGRDPGNLGEEVPEAADLTYPDAVGETPSM